MRSILAYPSRRTQQPRRRTRVPRCRPRFCWRGGPAGARVARGERVQGSTASLGACRSFPADAVRGCADDPQDVLDCGAECPRIDEPVPSRRAGRHAVSKTLALYNFNVIVWLWVHGKLALIKKWTIGSWS